MILFAIPLQSKKKIKAFGELVRIIFESLSFEKISCLLIINHTSIPREPIVYQDTTIQKLFFLFN